MKLLTLVCCFIPLIQGDENPPPGNYKPKISKECEELGICDDVADYPTDYATKLIDKMQQSKENSFNIDAFDTSAFRPLGPEEESLPLCSAQDTIYSPLAARTVDGKQWFYILNKKGEDAVQAFRVDICTKQNVTCNSVVSFATGNDGYCKQNYILRRMTGLDHEGRSFEDNFLVPGCCTCVYKVVN